MTVGDLNGDDVPDIVFSNAVAFLRAYFMQRDPQTGDLQVASAFDAYPYVVTATSTPPCATNGPDARMLTLGASGLDTPLIYDIDLDGINELIYLEHRSDTNSKGSICLQVYDFVDQPSPQLAGKINIANAPDLLSLVESTKYFSGNCTPTSTKKEHNRSFFMRIVNVRGRAYPQDVLVWTHDHDGTNMRVYAFDSGGPGGTASLSMLFEQTTMSGGVPVAWRGYAGHTWASSDIDYDGAEEIIGKNVLRWDRDHAPLPQKEIVWGMVFKNDHTSSESDTLCHPDHVSAWDLLQSYKDSNGKIVPSPGVEINVAPNIGGGANIPDKSGPWIYRAITGHELGNTPLSRVWPRKILNIAATADGAKYLFPSTAAGWSQPTPPGGGHESRWNLLGDEFNGTIVDVVPDAQCVLPIDILYHPDQGVDQRPGLELLVVAKGSFGDECTNAVGETHHVIDGSDSLAALAWEQSNQTLKGPSIFAAFPIDFFETRDKVEVHSMNRTACPPLFPTHTIFEWNPNPNTSAAKRYLPNWLYERQTVTAANDPSESVGQIDGSVGADLLGDSREELAFYITNDQTFVPGIGNSNSLLRIVRDVSSVARPEPSPWNFLDYKLRSNGHDPQPIDYKPLSGLRFRTKHLMPGVAGTPYGVVQDPQLLAGADPEVPNRGFAIIAEGGTPPYTFSILGQDINDPDQRLDGSTLPAGISATPLTWLPAGPLTTASHGGVYYLHGTSTSEATTRRFRVKVQDGNGEVVAQSFWLTIKPSFPTILSTVPRVYAAGFDGAYVLAGQATNVPIIADVSKSGGGTVTDVRVYDLTQSGTPLVTSLVHASGDRWTGTLALSAMAAGEKKRYEIVARDAQGNRSVPWPYLVINGGPGTEVPAFHSPAVPGQTLADTPTIERVQFGSNSMKAGEISDDSGVCNLTVHIKPLPAGTRVTKVEAIILHHLTGGDTTRYKAVRNIPCPGSTATSIPLIFNAPGKQFGWGYYTINVQVTVTKLISEDPDPCVQGTSYLSDWWPGLDVHQQ